MHIVICDDEPVYRRLLHEKIIEDSFAGGYEVELTEYGGAEQLVSALDAGKRADVYFLDIQMGKDGDDGIRVARELRSRGDNSIIVYVTGFIDYVQTGYEVRAFRYLLKSQIEDKLPEVLFAVRTELAGAEYYSFQINRETVRVEKDKILYLESDRRQIRLFAREGTFCFYGSLEQTAEELGEGFLRCHRSYLVNIKQIQRFSREEIGLKSGAVVPVSRSYAKECVRRLTIEMV